MLERYYRELLNFCTQRVKNRDVAADVVQESYAQVLAVQQSGEPIHAPRALLHQIARRLMIDQHRRLLVRKHDDINELAEVDQPTAPPHLQPDRVYAYEQHATALAEVIESLPPRCREAFVLNRFEGLSHQQVASQMGISKNMVAQHVMRAVLACQACEDRLNGDTALPVPLDGRGKD